MALTHESNYSKKVGLPGFSSHQFSLSLVSKLTDPAQVTAEAASSTACCKALWTGN